jgi:hypothetical protein
MTSEVDLQHNPLIHKMIKSNAIPGTVFRLPSKGIPYTNGELADEVLGGEILIYPMSTLDEIYLKSPDMLFQGTAVEKTLVRCCPQIIKPLELLAKDVDYILTCMRQVSYGNILTVPYECNCPKAKPIDLQVPVSDFLSKTKTISEKSLKQLTFTLDSFLIKTKYVRFGQMIKLNQENLTEGDEDTPDNIFDTFIKNLAANIESIDAIEDNNIIVDFLKAQQRSFQMSLLKNIQDINNWGVNFEYKFTCKYCDKVKTTAIALNPVSFFTEPSNQEPESKSDD